MGVRDLLCLWFDPCFVLLSMYVVFVEFIGVRDLLSLLYCSFFGYVVLVLFYLFCIEFDEI